MVSEAEITDERLTKAGFLLSSFHYIVVVIRMKIIFAEVAFVICAAVMDQKTFYGVHLPCISLRPCRFALLGYLVLFLEQPVVDGRRSHPLSE